MRTSDMERIKSLDEFIKDMNEIEKHNLSEQDMMTEMANISKKHTQLPINIWVESGSTRDTQHNIPRLKFQNSTSDKLSSNDLIPISISQEPEILIKDFDTSKLNISNKELNVLKNWIKFHYDNLMSYWNQEIDTVEFLDGLNKNKKDWDN